MVFCLVVFDKILVAAFNIGLYMSEHCIDWITVKIFIIIPMTVVCGFGINLYNFGTHRYFDFFKSVEN